MKEWPGGEPGIVIDQRQFVQGVRVGPLGGGTQHRKRPMKISIVDTSPVLVGSTAVEAFRTTAQLAELADQAGFSRYWLSELHGGRLIDFALQQPR